MVTGGLSRKRAARHHLSAQRRRLSERQNLVCRKAWAFQIRVSKCREGHGPAAKTCRPNVHQLRSANTDSTLNASVNARALLTVREKMSVSTQPMKRAHVKKFEIWSYRHPRSEVGSAMGSSPIRRSRGARVALCGNFKTGARLSLLPLTANLNFVHRTFMAGKSRWQAAFRTGGSVSFRRGPRPCTLTGQDRVKGTLDLSRRGTVTQVDASRPRGGVADYRMRLPSALAIRPHASSPVML